MYVCIQETQTGYSCTLSLYICISYCICRKIIMARYACYTLAKKDQECENVVQKPSKERELFQFNCCKLWKVEQFLSFSNSSKCSSRTKCHRNSTNNVFRFINVLTVALFQFEQDIHLTLSIFRRNFQTLENTDNNLSI